MRYEGRLTSWNDGKGYGFVAPNGGGNKVFVHIKSFSSRRRRPVEGDVVTYVVVSDSKNRLRADDVRYPGQSQSAPRQAASRYSAAVALILLFGCVVVALASLGKTPFLVPFLYVIASGITFVVYGFDKSAATNNGWRTQESTLHVLSVLGGWPGALLAQRMFRHKSRKLEFQVFFWLSVAVNCGVLAWSATESGATVIRTIFDAAVGSN